MTQPTSDPDSAAPPIPPAGRFVGECACGQVRFTAAASPLGADACHCRICQKVTGQAFFARAVFPRNAVNIMGGVVWYQSSPGFRRGFCPTCGATLFAERVPEGATISIALGAFEPAGAIAPQAHVWTSRKVEWVRLCDGLPTWPRFAPR